MLRLLVLGHSPTPPLLFSIVIGVVIPKTSTAGLRVAPISFVGFLVLCNLNRELNIGSYPCSTSSLWCIDNFERSSHSMLCLWGTDTVKVSKVKCHATQAMVDNGDVRFENLIGNDGPDTAGRSGQVKATR